MPDIMKTPDLPENVDIAEVFYFGFRQATSVEIWRVSYDRLFSDVLSAVSDVSAEVANHSHDIEILVDEGVSLLNSWVDYGNGFETFLVSKSLGIVYIQGLIKSGTYTDGTQLCLLSSGFRPSQNLVQNLVSAGGAPCRVQIGSDGRVLLYGASNNTYISLRTFYRGA